MIVPHMKWITRMYAHYAIGQIPKQHGNRRNRQSVANRDPSSMQLRQYSVGRCIGRWARQQKRNRGTG